MTIVTSIFEILGGLALFIYSMYLVNEGLQKAAGTRLKLILERLTDRPIKGIVGGAIITALVQSSSIVTVALVGLINAGLMTLERAAGVIIGANIGTTITAQIVAFNIGAYVFLVIAIGTPLIFLNPRSRLHSLGQILLGFGLLFLGMQFMTQGTRPLQESPQFVSMMVTFATVPVLGTLAGALFTGIIQNSAATTGLLIAMGMENVITLKAAIAILIGANIGTCVTALLASIGSSTSARRAAIFHVFFNVMGACIFVPFISRYTEIISLTSAHLPRQIANAHLIFNIGTAFLILPFIYSLIRIVKFIVPGKEHRIDRGIKFLDDRMLRTPSLAIEQAEKETLRMGKIAHEMLEQSRVAFLEGDKELIKVVLRKEDAVDEIYHALDHYLNRISNKSLNEHDRKRLAILMHSIGDIERVGDHVNNIVELAERKGKERLRFTADAMEELDAMFTRASEVYGKMLAALENNSKAIAVEVKDIEAQIDLMEKDYEQHHIQRLKRKICNPTSGIIFVDTLRNLERISDHATNIANAVIAGF